jgi:hypothetical protein
MAYTTLRIQAVQCFMDETCHGMSGRARKQAVDQFLRDVMLPEIKKSIQTTYNNVVTF